MKFLFFLYFILLSNNIFAEDWKKTTFSEDAENQYWVGLSSPQKSEKEALNEAYNEALNEASKYNFGFNQESQENFYANKTDSQYHSQSNIVYKKIQFSEVKPIAQEIIKNGDNFIAYRKISYPKKEILKEKNRLANTMEIKTKEKNIPSHSNNLGSILIKNDIPLLIQLISELGNSFIIKSNEISYLPIGSYKMYIKQEGFSFIQKDIIISGQPLVDSIILEKNKSHIFFDVFPKDAKILIKNNLFVNGETIALENGQYEIIIEHPNFSSQIININLASDSTVSAKLLPKNSSISIITNPADADVFINGAFIGKSPILGHTTALSNKTMVSISKNEYKFLVENIKVNPNQINSFNFNLEKIK